MGFLEDFIYKPEQQQVMKTAVGGALNMLKARVDEVDRNINLSKLLTYKRIQFQRIDITNIAYSLSSLLNNSQVISLIGGSKNMSLEKRLEMWNSMTALEQANILDMAGYYLELTDDVLASLTDDLKKKRFDIIDFQLCDLGNNLLIRNVDYVFYDNKLMLLKEFLDDGNYKKKYLIMKNIVIDAGLTESVLGGFMHMPSNKELTKVEYNEILKGFTEAASKGPIIGEYRTALNRYKSLEGVRVYDKLNADPTRRHFWGNDDKLGEFTKFDFIVSMPVQLVYKPEKLEYIINFFNQTKPAYANFVFSPELTVTDTIPMKAMPTLFRTKSWMSGVKDKIKSKAITEYLSSHTFEESFLLNTRVKHQAVKTPIYHAFDKYDLFEKETKASYLATEHILDIIPSKTQVLGFLTNSFLDRVQIGKGIGADSYRLDEDYFDAQVISDPLFAKINIEIADIIEYCDSRIQLTSIQSPTDNIVYDELLSKILNVSFGDYVKVFNNSNDYVYISDENDYLDSLVIYDSTHLLIVNKNLVDSIPPIRDSFGTYETVLSLRDNIVKINTLIGELSITFADTIVPPSDNITTSSTLCATDIIEKTEDLSILNAKNLYDRMSNMDIASKTVSDECFDKAHMVNKANILKCDSIFDCDYMEESCMAFDSAPDGYDESIEADFISRESIHLELIPKIS